MRFWIASWRLSDVSRAFTHEVDFFRFTNAMAGSVVARVVSESLPAEKSIVTAMAGALRSGDRRIQFITGAKGDF